MYQEYNEKSSNLITKLEDTTKQNMQYDVFVKTFKQESIEKYLTLFKVAFNIDVVKSQKPLFAGKQMTAQAAFDLLGRGLFVWNGDKSAETIDLQYSSYYNLKSFVKEYGIDFSNNVKQEEADGTFEGLFCPAYKTTIEDLTLIDLEAFVKSFYAYKHSLAFNCINDYVRGNINAFANIELVARRCIENGQNFPVWLTYKGKVVVVDLAQKSFNDDPSPFDGGYVLGLQVKSIPQH